MPDFSSVYVYVIHIFGIVNVPFCVSCTYFWYRKFILKRYRDTGFWYRDLRICGIKIQDYVVSRFQNMWYQGTRMWYVIQQKSVFA